VERYSRADSKAVKSALVFNIVTVIRQAGGHFCKYEKGTWFEVGDRCAREKVSAYFRDKLHTQYRSSAKARTTRRRDRNRNKRQTQIQQHNQQLVDGTGGHSEDDDDFSMSWGSSLHVMWFDYALEIDFFDIDVF
jgi:nucleoside 2-deoxyribosyltransferase